MKVSYDPKVDAAYLELLKSEPEGVIEVAEGIHIDMTSDGKMRDNTFFLRSKMGSCPGFFQTQNFLMVV